MRLRPLNPDAQRGHIAGGKLKSRLKIASSKRSHHIRTLGSALLAQHGADRAGGEAGRWSFSRQSFERYIKSLATKTPLRDVIRTSCRVTTVGRAGIEDEDYGRRPEMAPKKQFWLLIALSSPQVARPSSRGYQPTRRPAVRLGWRQQRRRRERATGARRLAGIGLVERRAVGRHCRP